MLGSLERATSGRVVGSADADACNGRTAVKVLSSRAKRTRIAQSVEAYCNCVKSQANPFSSTRKETQDEMPHAVFSVTLRLHAQ